MNQADSDITNIQVDLVILGGGIAGLWLLNHFCNKGYHCILLEANALGAGQSMASQGIIHGGLKYALDGSLSAAARAIATMPERWEQCLRGSGDVDLTACELLSPHYYMWSEGSYRSRLKSFFGSKALRGKISTVAPEKYPALFDDQQASGYLYQLSDFVIDSVSLINTLANNYRDRLFQVPPDKLQIYPGNSGENGYVTIKSNNRSIIINSQRTILAAGEGNQGLLQQAGLLEPEMQTRPLHMVMLSGKSLPEGFVHCVGDDFSMTPALTLTSHLTRTGVRVWYLGGEIAEAGVTRDSQAQINASRDLLEKTFGWINFSDVRWLTFMINRAEGKLPNKHRPDSVFVSENDQLLVTWPTKFTLSPALADAVSRSLNQQDIMPRYNDSLIELANLLPSAHTAQPPWERFDE